MAIDKEERNKRRRKRYLLNRDKELKQKKQYNSRPEIKIRNREYKQKKREENPLREKLASRKSYEKYRKNNIKKIQEYSKKNNYKYEKTDIQRKLRGIKRRTRYFYPLEGHLCEVCGNKAQVRHHNTKPIEFDKFNYLCNKCHKEVHRK